MNAFAVELRRLRKLRLLTQQELSRAAKVPLRTISDLERGISQQPHPATVRKLAAGLRLTGAELAGFQSAARATVPNAADQASSSPASAMAAGAAETRSKGKTEPKGRSRAAGLAAVQTLPRDIGSFTGRKDQLRELLDKEDPAAAGGIWVVDGMAGVGKTAFALHAAHRLAERFPDGQLFLELRGHIPDQAPADPADALSSLLQTIGIDARQIPQGTQERVRLWRDRLAGKRLILLLDDAADTNQVRPLLPGTPGCLVLVTSRARLTALEDVRVISLRTLPPDEAALLFVRLASRPALSPADPAVEEIVRLSGCLPLAVGILAALLRHHDAWTPAWLAADLAAARSRIGLMHAENRSVADAFALSYRDLGSDEQLLFRRLGMYPGTDIDVYAAAALNGTAVATTRRILDALYNQHLIGEPGAGRYRLHDLLREHAGQLAGNEQPSEHQAALGRLLDYYLHAVRAADRHLARHAPPVAETDDARPEIPDMGTRQAATDWMETERLNLHAAVIATLPRSPAYAAAIPAAMSAFLRAQGHWDQARILSRTAIEAARRTRDRHAQAVALIDLAKVQRMTSDFTSAIASGHNALRLYRALGDRSGQADALTHTGWVRYLVDDFTGASASLSQARDLYRLIGHPAGEADALIHLAHVFNVTGDLPGATSSLSRARDLYRDLRDLAGEADVLEGLGLVQSQNGPFAAAVATLAESVKLYQGLGDRWNEAWGLNFLAYTQIRMGALAPAVSNLALALQIFGALGNQYAKATALNYLGMAHRLGGDYPAATTAQEEALKLYRTHHSQVGESNALREIGLLQLVTGDLQAASASHAQALEISQKVNNLVGEAECRNNIGDILLATGPAQAFDSYERALLICRDTTAQLEEGRSLEGIGICELRDDRPGEASKHLRQALTIYQRLGSPNSRHLETLLRLLS